jgi:hypothetical protein
MEPRLPSWKALNAAAPVGRPLMPVPVQVYQKQVLRELAVPDSNLLCVYQLSALQNMGLAAREWVGPQQLV